MMQVAVVLLTITAVGYLVNQCRKPTGWVGRFLVWDMNDRHSAVTDWGLERVAIGKSYTMLDIGCGGGRTVHKLAAVATQGKVHGIDYSSASVAASRKTNAEWIKAGRVEIQQACVSRLPFADGLFDLVTAVETHYYWPDLAASLREILRVLKPGGKLVVIAEAYKGGRYDKLNRVAMMPLRGAVLSVDEHRDLLSKASYSPVEVREEYKRGWICAIAGRP